MEGRVERADDRQTPSRTARTQDQRSWSLLISSGADVKVVQARLLHRSAKTTLDVYGHLFPDSDDKTRTAVDAALARRADFLRTGDVIA